MTHWMSEAIVHIHSRQLFRSRLLENAEMTVGGTDDNLIKLEDHGADAGNDPRIPDSFFVSEIGDYAKDLSDDDDEE